MKAKFFMASVAALLVTGCSHNTGTFFAGTRFNAGLDPQNATLNMSYDRGVAVVDVARENSTWDIKVDSSAGVSIDPDSGTVKGIESIRREVGPQITGYLVELAQSHPDFALEYIKAVQAYWNYRARDKPQDGEPEGK